MLILLSAAATLPSACFATPVEGVEAPALEARIIALTNIERARHGLAPLVADADLTRAARAHSEEMVRLDYFAHESPTAALRTPARRVAKAGCTDVEVGENIAFYEGYGPDEAVRRVVSDWMNSPGHRANILRSSYTHIGIGLAWGGGKLTVSQELSGRHLTIDVLELSVAGDTRVVRLEGRAVRSAREVAIFTDGQSPQRVGVDANGRFIAVVLLRREQISALRLGVLAERRSDGASFRIVNVVPLRADPVTAR